ncbi:hypothetical protein PCL_07678 [Purpureocillium lilacinum]|uniref:Uncharacterized protein n=1 Tax=Purpureocillium lilacinum TaxID=33203 RepID=A0A2U3EIM4_PURLI|nr:hypothetical protein Purlil1_4435 [Purpureocillium lilacinum]PWI74364.1 hypothetical protein PCL_07678 [Purpureocillium lilacinum]
MRRPRDWWGACVRGGRGGGMARKGDTGDLGRDRDGGCGTAGRRAGGQADEEESGLERQRQDKASRRRIATADVMLHRGASVLLLSCVCGSRLGKALDARRELRRQPMQPRSAAHACAWVRLRIGELKTDTYVRRNRVSVSRPAGSQQASVSAAFVRGGTSSSRWCMGRVAAHDDGWLGGGLQLAVNNASSTQNTTKAAHASQPLPQKSNGWAVLPARPSFALIDKPLRRYLDLQRPCTRRALGHSGPSSVLGLRVVQQAKPFAAERFPHPAPWSVGGGRFSVWGFPSFTNLPTYRLRTSILPAGTFTISASSQPNHPNAPLDRPRPSYRSSAAVKLQGFDAMAPRQLHLTRPLAHPGGVPRAATAWHWLAMHLRIAPQASETI